MLAVVPLAVETVNGVRKVMPSSSSDVGDIVAGSVQRRAASASASRVAPICGPAGSAAPPGNEVPYELGASPKSYCSCQKGCRSWSNPRLSVWIPS